MGNLILVVRAFQEFPGLASTQIRRVLADRCRRFLKAPLVAKRFEMQLSVEPGKLAKWIAFPEKVVNSRRRGLLFLPIGQFSGP